MADPTAAPPLLPAHIGGNHSVHRPGSTPSIGGTPRRCKSAVDRMTTLLSRPGFIGMVTVIVVGWASLNLLAGALGYRAHRAPALFSGLAGAVSLASLYMVVLILATQRREDQLAQHREQLILELALLSEQKTAKVIELLEEIRRDNPHIHDRVDRQADAMAQPADPQQMLDAIKEIRAEAAQVSGAAGAEDKGSGPAG